MNSNPPFSPRQTPIESRSVQLLGPVEIRELADSVGVSPTKKLGQNFVHDPNTVRKIVSAADLTADDHVIEIGPGLGSLTLALLEVAPMVTAVEIDPALANRLPLTIDERTTNALDNFRLIHKDALALTRDDVESAWGQSGAVDQGSDAASVSAPHEEEGQGQSFSGVYREPTAIVANLPYNVSVPVLLHMLEIFPSIRRVLVMVQAEVADRLAAEPGNKVYGVPSVKARFYGTVRRAGSIGRNVFWPAPNVDSGLVRMDCMERPWEQTDESRTRLWPVVDAAFAQRRKTLRAALGAHYGSPALAEEALVQAGIDPKRRGETLTIDEFARLAGIVVGN